MAWFVSPLRRSMALLARRPGWSSSAGFQEGRDPGGCDERPCAASLLEATSREGLASAELSVGCCKTWDGMAASLEAAGVALRGGEGVPLEAMLALGAAPRPLERWKARASYRYIERAESIAVNGEMRAPSSSASWQRTELGAGAGP